jgi:hypothetical protein
MDSRNLDQENLDGQTAKRKVGTECFESIFFAPLEGCIVDKGWLYGAHLPTKINNACCTLLCWHVT